MTPKLLPLAEAVRTLIRDGDSVVLGACLEPMIPFAVTYELNAYTRTPEKMPALYTALHRHILDVFNEHGVVIMTPAYEGDPEQPKLVPKEQWYAAPAVPEKGTQAKV